MSKPRILLVQLNSNGDCLYATVLAKQIKEVDYPGCHLTWAINSRCKQTILLNHFVDDIWEYPTQALLTTEKEWAEFTQLAEKRKRDGDFDMIFYTQVIGSNIINFDGGIRSSMYNNYPHPVTVSKQPVLVLSDNETQNVKTFARSKALEKFKHVLLIECGPDSFKSSLNPASAYSFAELITNKSKDVAVILSSNKKIKQETEQIIDGSVLSFRENAELTKYCSLFIGCSSGISWITTTDWAKPLNKIIITNKSSNYTFSMYYDHLYADLPVDHIIEFPENEDALSRLEQCVASIVDDSFESAKRSYHAPNKIAPHKYIYHLSRLSFSRGNYTDPLTALKRNFTKNGFNVKALMSLMKAYVKLPVYVFKRH